MWKVAYLSEDFRLEDVSSSDEFRAHRAGVKGGGQP